MFPKECYLHTTYIFGLRREHPSHVSKKTGEGPIWIVRNQTCLAPEYLITDDQACCGVDRPREVLFCCRHVYLWAYSGRNERSCAGVGELGGRSGEVTRKLADAGEHEEICRTRLEWQPQIGLRDYSVRGQWVAKILKPRQEQLRRKEVFAEGDTVIEACEPPTLWAPKTGTALGWSLGPKWAGHLVAGLTLLWRSPCLDHLSLLFDLNP